MKEFTYSYPTRVYFGEGSAAKALCAELPKVGKTVILAYGGGSGFSGTQETIAKLEPGAAMLKDKSISRSSIEDAQPEIINWLQSIGMLNANP